MRSAKEFINIMKEQFEEQYNYLKNKANEVNEQGEHEYFLGLRKDSVCLYYRGMRMAEISLVGGDKIEYEMDKYYNPKENKKPLSFFEFSQKDNFEYIKKKIDMHVTGLHDNKKKKEKVCQQWIINKNNESESEWYFIDMEYVFDICPYGRPDMIAIKRKVNEQGKHEVALVEFKVGTDAYKGLKCESYNKKKGLYEYLKKDLYDDNQDLRKVKYGSGIVSHIADFLRFLKNPDNYKIQLRKELVDMISVHKQLGLIEETDNLCRITNIDFLEEKPTIYILSYAYTPLFQNMEKTKLSSMKKSMYNYLYDSEFSLIRMLNEKQIDGFIDVQDILKEKIKDNEQNIVECVQKIGDNYYTFIFEFRDPDDVKYKEWECLMR